MMAESAYPSQWETHVVLSDGSPAELRPIRPGDRERLVDFHRRQSAESIYFRFFRHRPELSDKELDYFTQVDYVGRMAFVALVGDRLVGVGRYERLGDSNVAEVAFFIDDDHHGLGIATIMLEYLAAAARSVGLEGFTASVLPENYSMLAVFRRAGFDVSTRFDEGVIEVELGIEITPEASSAIVERRRRARVRSVHPVLAPRSVMLIGASRHAGEVGYELARNLIGAEDAGRGFAGSVALVNQAARIEDGAMIDVLFGQPLIPSIEEAATVLAAAQAEQQAAHVDSGEEPADHRGIDLAIVAVPARETPGVIDRCAAVGVRSLFVVSSGFSEGGAEGQLWEDALTEKALSHGMRLVGPNAFGLANTDPEVRLNALFLPIRPRPGPIAVASDSGPLGAALLNQLSNQLADEHVGVSDYVGIGNQADIDVPDLLDYWARADRTRAVVLYLEDLGERAELIEAVGSITPHKPVVMIAPGDAILAQALHQRGALLVEDVGQLADQAMLAVLQPIPKGRRVAIVSNTASVARLTAAACSRNGLEIVKPQSTSDGSDADSFLVGNLDTVSLEPHSEIDVYERTIVAAAVSDEVDSLILALAPTALLPPEKLRRLLDRINRAIDKPIVAVALVGRELVSSDRLPTFTFPEKAAQALGRWARHGSWQTAHLASAEVESSEPASSGEASAPSDRVAFQLEASLGDADGVTLGLADPTMPAWLDLLALPVADFEVGTSLASTERAATSVGYPVVLKAGHLTKRAPGESGGAALDLYGPVPLRGAYERMTDLYGPAMDRAVVQKLVVADHVIRIDLVQQADVGAFVSVGFGGWWLRSSQAVAQHLVSLPGALGQSDAEAMAAEIVDAVAGQPSMIGPIAELIGLVGAAPDVAPEVSFLSLNPIFVTAEKATVIDVYLRLRRLEHHPLSEVRHL